MSAKHDSPRAGNPSEPPDRKGGRYRSRNRSKTRFPAGRLFAGTLAVLAAAVPITMLYRDWRADHEVRRLLEQAEPASKAGLVISEPPSGALGVPPVWQKANGEIWFERSASTTHYVETNTSSATVWVFDVREIDADGRPTANRWCGGPREIEIQPGRAVPFVFQHVREPQRAIVDPNGNITSTLSDVLFVSELLVLTGAQDQPVPYVERELGEFAGSMTQALSEQVDEQIALCDEVRPKFAPSWCGSLADRRCGDPATPGATPPRGRACRAHLCGCFGALAVGLAPVPATAPTHEGPT
ncbi:MAG: hypothetical protein IE923_02020 [Micrococcales bacterium]|nr:hypothetical protein [Micrococcales bacterium]